MASQTNKANARLRDLFDLFLQDIQALGIFASHATLKKEAMETFLTNREGIFDLVLQGGEALQGLALENASLPVLYNTRRWPEQAPLAGYFTSDSGINYSHILATYFGNWAYECSHGPFYPRLIRASLWMWYKNDLESAVQYLFDLQKHGYFIIEQGLEDTIAILIASQSLGKDPQEIIAAYFDGKVPQSNTDWMNWDIQVPQQTFANIDSEAARPILEFIIMETLAEWEYIRSLDDPVAWLLRQAAFTTRCGQVKHLCLRFSLKPTVMLKSILNQFEEIHADGSVYLSYRTWAKFAPLKSPLSLQASYMLKIFQSQFGEKGEERLYHDRLIYPAVLREPLTKYGAETLREQEQLFEWSIVPPKIFHSYAACFSVSYPDSAVRSAYFPAEQVAEVPLVRQFFELSAIQEQEARVAILHQVYHERLIWSQQLDALLTEQRKQLLEILGIAHQTLCHEELQRDLIAAITMTDSGAKERMLSHLHTLYPWFPAVYRELAIFFDEGGDPQRAWDFILTAVLLEPDQAMNWQSLGRILQRLGDSTGARFARAIKEFLAERKQQ